MTTPFELYEQLAPFVRRVKETAPEHVLDQVTASLSVAKELERLGEILVNHFVEAARTAGHSWAEIGTSLGVTRQAAQQRLGRFQQVPMGTDGLRDKSSPFAAWRLTDDDEIEVQVEASNAWQRLVSLDGHTDRQLMEASWKSDPKRWFKRLSEELADVYEELGAELGSTATAELIDAGGRRATREVDVTIAKRKAAVLHNRAG